MACLPFALIPERYETHFVLSTPLHDREIVAQSASAEGSAQAPMSAWWPHVNGRQLLQFSIFAVPRQVTAAAATLGLKFAA
jgi:hypothetical protein